MFGYTRIKKSVLDSLHWKVDRLEKEVAKEHANYISEAHHSMKLQDKLVNSYQQLNDLEAELLKYKELYADELQKRLDLVKEVKELEAKLEDKHA